MKRLLALMLCAVSLGVGAQTTIVLTVDMSNETVSADGVHVAGSFQGWDPGSTPMIDNGDGTWTYSFTSDTAATYQYRFINGNSWGFDESISAACAVDGNRQIEVDGVMGDIESAICFGRCGPCDLSTVLFRVDMSNESVSPFGVHVAGDFQGWDPGATELTDPDGDMIYESLEVLPPSTTSIVYKFINGNDWTDHNEVVGGECGDIYGNRTLEIGNAADIILSANALGDAYCFDQCSSCEGSIEVTFTVDMGIVPEVSEEGVHLAGSFQGWDPGATPMTEIGDTMWSTTIDVSQGYHEFIFINGASWNGGSENMYFETSCNGTFDEIHRGAVFDVDNNTYTACFNRCPEDPCIPDPEPANLTFQVDLGESDLAGESVFVCGDFTGWQGGAIEMEDIDGVWTTTQLVSGAANVLYVYSIGYPVGENQETGRYTIGLDSLGLDSTNFEAAGCGVPNGFGGFNRRFIRSGIDEVIPLHCYNRCDACNGEGCTDGNACNYDPSAFVNDGSCLYFDAFGECGGDCAEDANSDGICDDLVDCVNIGAGFWQDLELGVYPSTPSPIIPDSIPVYGYQLTVGEDLTEELVLNVPLVFVDEVTGGAFQVLSWSNLVVAGLPPGVELILPPALDGASQACVELTGDDYPTLEGFYEVVITGEVLLNFFGAPFSIGDVSTSFWVEVVSNPNGVPGCTYPTASNYMPWATYDSGACEYAGCTDPSALNYSPRHSVDDGSCFYNDPNCVAESACPEDLNGDGAVGTPDLLLMLGEFGNSCD